MGMDAKLERSDTSRASERSERTMREKSNTFISKYPSGAQRRETSERAQRASAASEERAERRPKRSERSERAQRGRPPPPSPPRPRGGERSRQAEQAQRGGRGAKPKAKRAGNLPPTGRHASEARATRTEGGTNHAPRNDPPTGGKGGTNTRASAASEHKIIRASAASERLRLLFISEYWHTGQIPIIYTLSNIRSKSSYIYSIWVVFDHHKVFMQIVFEH